MLCFRIINIRNKFNQPLKTTMEIDYKEKSINHPLHLLEHGFFQDC